mmetsp:Transcript_7866/g.20212  ORF Transcript_7866/g.20212 Transcript_7866/m.20212 type:complete len:212 (-) Transcript_7866:125-760(-)
MTVCVGGHRPWRYSHHRQDKGTMSCTLKLQQTARSDAHPEGADKVGRPRDNVVKLDVRQPLVAIEVGLHENLLCHLLHLRLLELTVAAQRLERPHKVRLANIPVVVKVVNSKGVRRLYVSGGLFREDGHHVEEVLKPEVALAVSREHLAHPPPKRIVLDLRQRKHGVEWDGKVLVIRLLRHHLFKDAMDMKNLLFVEEGAELVVLEIQFIK